MTDEEKRIIQAKVDALPIGGITYKTINGKKYPYLQWTENGKQRGRRVKAEELERLQAGIDERKRLQALLKDIRKYFEVTGQLLQGNDQRQYILNTEAPRQTQLFEQDYREGSPNKRLYFVMQYLGRFSVWMDLFPQEFDELKLLHFCPDAYWMKDLLVFLRKHETLDKIYGHFDELKDVLTENWTFEE